MKNIENKLKNDALVFKQNYDDALHNKIMGALPEQIIDKPLINKFHFIPLVPVLLVLCALLYTNLPVVDSLSLPSKVELIQRDALINDLLFFEEQAVQKITQERQAILDDFSSIQSLIVL